MITFWRSINTTTYLNLYDIIITDNVKITLLCCKVGRKINITNMYTTMLFEFKISHSNDEFDG